MVRIFIFRCGQESRNVLGSFKRLLTKSGQPSRHPQQKDPRLCSISWLQLNVAAIIYNSFTRINSVSRTLLLRCLVCLWTFYATPLLSVARLLSWRLDTDFLVQSSIMITFLHPIKSATYGGIALVVTFLPDP
ncbi:hypothetical protein C8R48DRAFT_728759 [Suillus tomentosus]|nr:hypothetical protein C8R48DRAFT_728759 [Suillus tomentosus]